MILTVTPNPALDLTYHVDRLTLGDTHRVGTPHAQAGGKGLNVARVLHQVGGRVHAILPVGGAIGRAITDELTRAGIPHTTIPVAAQTRRTVTIVDGKAADHAVLSESGTPLSETELAAVHATVARQVGQARCLVIAGSLPPQTPESLYAALIDLARSQGTPTVVDATGSALRAAARAGADLLKPNRAELAAATGVDDPLVGATALIAAGAAAIAVSLGPDGLLIVTERRALRAFLPKPLRGNPCGAGDAAVAAMAQALVERCDLTELARRAVAWSAAAVLAPVAGVLAPEYRNLGDQVVLHEER